jgi:hypothetical protein
MSVLEIARRRRSLLGMAPDTAERHRIVASLASSPRTVLDVGGVRGQLAPFLPGAEITAVNVSGDGNVTFDGVTLPFPDGSFEAVTSLDVLEHIAPAQRPRHLDECLRVASRVVVLCCPAGTPEHVAAERELADWYAGVFGSRHPFLEEHLAIGLPSPAELAELAARAGGRLRFHGDFRRTNAEFRITMLARHRPSPRRLARFARTRLRTAEGWPLTAAATAVSNRAYLVVQKRHQTA